MTYTIFDGNPATSGPCAWPDHEDVEIDAASVDKAEEAIREIMERNGGEYDDGDKLWAIIWDDDDTILRQFSLHFNEDK